MKKREKEITHYSQMAITVVFILISLLFLVLVVIISMHNENLDADKRRLHTLAMEMTERIQTTINEHMEKAAHLSRYIESKGDEADFVRIVDMLDDEPAVREVVFAPDCIVKTAVVDSLPQPEMAGVSLLEGEGGEETRIAFAQNRQMLAGPFFHNPGQAQAEEKEGFLLIRYPVLKDRMPWGVIGMTLDFPQVLDRTFLLDLEKYGYVFSLLQENDDGQADSILWQSGGAVAGESAKHRFSVGNLHWNFEMARLYDVREGIRYWLYAIGLTLVCLLVGMLIYHYLHLHGIKKFLETLAMTDGLTGLPNRRATMDALNKLVEAATRKREPFVLLYMDLNGFKKVNDTYGHEKGDRVLKRTADILQHNIKDMGHIGRVGGDEFVFLLEGMVDGKMLDRVIEKLSDRLQMTVAGSGAEEDTTVIVPVSASFGVASFPLDGQDAETLLHAADLKMYQSKRELKGSTRVGPYKSNFR